MARDHAAVINALNARLRAFQSGAMNNYINWEGDDFSPPSDHLWIRQHTIWQIPRMLGAVEGQYRDQGIYQLTVKSKLGTGVIQAADLASDLMNWFERGSVLTYSGVNVKIESTYRTTSLPEAPWMNTPVTVVFWYYAQYGS